ncbi:hypothetical protein Ami103574_04860 [Aminipila butyrica]|uniref:RNase H type-1 domain-containing protein n=1 Tax=Aminipila butyrica TaxID=433296 RepID=A0A858BU23_9FIRM|nr:hypothetical protein [Aminipila butyrica]QIB68689.1 hypothetical protein Ami103574_04860 [Aminipila butyrica]
MIKAYLAAFPTLYEGEDIEVRYSLFQDDMPIKKESIYLEYMKPAIVGLDSILTMLLKLEEYKEQEITIIINDASLYEIIKGCSTTQNGDVLKMANKMKKQLAKFKKLSFVNVTKDKAALAEWKEILED